MNVVPHALRAHSGRQRARVAARLAAEAPLVLVLALALGACATAGTRPHDMSAAEHDQAAQHEEQEAEEHRAQYDDDAWTTSNDGCASYCFDTWSNPTEVHLREARRHRALAAKHRKASQALRDAEAENCVGIPERDRDISPFFHAVDIEEIEQVSASDTAAEYVVRFGDVPGLDAAGMQMLIDCHLARNAVIGPDMPEMDYCPLVVPGVEASVEPGEAGFRVRIRVDGEAGAARLAQTIQRLEARTTSEPGSQP